MSSFTAALIVLLFFLMHSASAAPVSIVAYDFLTIPHTKWLVGFPVIHLETGDRWVLGNEGRLTLDFKEGTNVTFFVPATAGYHATQSATVTVPPEGLNSPLSEIALQVPSELMVSVLRLFMGHEEKDSCQVVVTITDANKGFNDFPHGVSGATAAISPSLFSSTTRSIYYFGTWGDWSNCTNPLPNELESTSIDGGVLFRNVPVAVGVEYMITATKPGARLSSTRVRCEAAGGFINAGANQGPRVLHEERRVS